MSDPDSNVFGCNLFSFDYELYQQQHNVKFSPEKECPEYPSTGHNNNDSGNYSTENFNYNNNDYKQYDAKISPDSYSQEYSHLNMNDYNTHPLQEELPNLSVSREPEPEPLLFAEPNQFREYPHGSWYTPDTNYYTGTEISVQNSDETKYSNYHNNAKISPDSYSQEYSNFNINDYNTHPLQKDLQNLSISKEPEPFLFAEPNQFREHINYSSYTSDTNNYTGSELSVHKLDETGNSSPHNGLNDVKEHSHALEMDDDADFSEEVDKRLNQMVSVPHIPKINGDIPSIDDANAEYQRLVNRLEACNLIERIVEADGNCQFRALSDQVYQTPEHHLFVRKKVVRQLKANRDMYEGYVPMSFNKYLKRMSKSGEWGDHVTLQAAADLYGMKIILITSFEDTCYLEIPPKIQKSESVICLSYWSEVHYNSIYTREGSSCD